MHRQNASKYPVRIYWSFFLFVCFKAKKCTLQDCNTTYPSPFNTENTNTARIRGQSIRATTKRTVTDKLMNTPQEGNHEYAKILGVISPSLPSLIPGDKTYTYFDRFLWLVYILLFSSLCQQRPCAEREDGSAWLREKDTSWFLLFSKSNFKHQTIPLFPLFSVVRLTNFFTIPPPPQKKGTGRCLTFWTLIGSFNLNNEHRNSISRNRSFSGVSFLLCTISSTIIFPTTLSLCRFGDHILLFPGSTALMLGFRTSFSQGFCALLCIDANEKKREGNGITMTHKYCCINTGKDESAWYLQ